MNKANCSVCTYCEDRAVTLIYCKQKSSAKYE